MDYRRQLTNNYFRYILYMSLSLEEIVDNSRTDKNTLHSYLPLYETLLVNKKETAKNILEIGISSGGSIKLWNDYFQNATIYGIDIMNINNVWDEIKNTDKIKLYTSVDAYDIKFFMNNVFKHNIKYDIILDDGPHSLDSMKTFIILYSHMITEDGLLIIEDVQSWDWINVLKNEVPDDLKPYIYVYDLRSNKNRYDDIVFTIDKSKLPNPWVYQEPVIQLPPQPLPQPLPQPSPQIQPVPRYQSRFLQKYQNKKIGNSYINRRAWGIALY